LIGGLPRFSMSGMRQFLLINLVAVLAVGCGESTRNRPTLRILCGASMSDPMQELGNKFARQNGVEVIFDLGNSETLMTRVQVDAPADVFICHDPFEADVKKAGKLTSSVAIAGMQPVLLVRPGNPKGINSIADLTRPGIKIGTGNEQSTCGQMFMQLLDQKGLREKVMANVALQGRTHVEIANGLIAGPLDAVVVWNFIAELYKGKVQRVPTDDRYLLVRVTILGLTQSPSPRVRDEFLEYCKTPAARETFIRYGYSRLAE